MPERIWRGVPEPSSSWNLSSLLLFLTFSQARTLHTVMSTLQKSSNGMSGRNSTAGFCSASCCLLLLLDLCQLLRDVDALEQDGRFADRLTGLHAVEGGKALNALVLDAELCEDLVCGVRQVGLQLNALQSGWPRAGCTCTVPRRSFCSRPSRAPTAWSRRYTCWSGAAARIPRRSRPQRAGCPSSSRQPPAGRGQPPSAHRRALPARSAPERCRPKYFLVMAMVRLTRLPRMFARSELYALA